MKISLLSFITLFFLGCISQPNPIKQSYTSHYIHGDYLKTLDFSKNNILSVSINGEWYYIREDGKSILVIDDKGRADRFQEGLARTKINGKIGFFNKNLDIVLSPRYDFAFPFYDGVAEICVGCKEIEDSDYNMLDGGEWKRINRTGLILEE